MKVKIIGDRSGRVWPLVLHAARESLEAGRRMILYVPEQMTLQAEKDLVQGLDLPGLLEIRVISPRKLRLQVREQTGTGARRSLNEPGRAMAVQRVMAEKKKELSFYRDMADLPGAVKRVGEALEELRESEITPEELAEYAAKAPTGAERAKMGDLRIIWDGYRELTAEEFEDEKTAWTDTVTRLEQSGMWDGENLAVYGFDTVRPDLRELLTRLCGRMNALSVFLVMDGENAPDGRIFTQQRESVQRLEAALAEAGHAVETVFPHGEREGCAEELKWLDRNLFALNPQPWKQKTVDALALYAGSTPWDEAGNIAATLRAWHEEGIAWNGMAVALPAGAAADGMLRAVMKINNIPCVWQQKDRAADHPVCRLLLAALACLNGDWRTENVITIARSGFSTLNDAEGLALEDYGRAHGIRWNWDKPFRAGKNAGEAEQLRRKVLDPVVRLKAALKKAPDAKTAVTAVAAFLDEEQVWTKLQEEEELLLKHEMYREAVINRQIRKLLTDLMEQICALLGSRRADPRDLKNMLESALNQAELASLPEQESGVVIGTVGHLLAGSIEALILPRAQDGMLTAPESGWLSDPERRRMEEAVGKPIGISREMGCLICKYDFYRTLTLPRKKLMISRSLRAETGGALQPDGLIARIRELFPGLTEQGGVLEEGRQDIPATPQAALDGIGARLCCVRSGEAADLSGEWKDALIRLLYSGRYGQTARRMLDELVPREKEQRLEQETARRLFMTDRLSVSRLEQFASCPYRHFIDYGLRPVKQEEFTYESNDAGTFFHQALDRYMKRAAENERWPDISEQETEGYMDAVCAELTQEWEDTPLSRDALGEWTGEGYLRRVRRAAQVLTRFAANSDFRTIGTEMAFGDGDSLPPIVLNLTDGSKATIRGRIDRIDTWENGEGVWLRVVDYKSGEKKPDLEKMKTGEQLQLMIYLKAASESQPGARPAGALFFPVQDREVHTADDDPEAIRADRMNTARMKGVVNADRDVIRAMDRDISPLSVDKVFNQDGSVSKSAPWAMEEEELIRRMDDAAAKAGELCGRMRDGEIAASPAGDSAGSVCRYCEYQAICRAAAKKDRRQETEDDDREAVRKNTLRESEKQRIIAEEKTL